MMAQDEQSELKNNVTIEQVGPCKKRVVIEIPEEKIKEVTEQQYEDLRREVVLPGFRKGRAPKRLLEKRFGKETNEQTKLKLLADASESAMKDNDLNALADPDINHEDIEMPAEGPLKFDFEIEVRPEFDLPELEGIEVEKSKLEVADEQVDSELEQLRKYAGVWVPRKDGKAEPEDQIIADTILKIEGVEEEEKLNNSEIFVRANGFVGSIPVEKLDELLIGAKAGDTKKISVDVPKTYFKEEYRGKKVDIEIEIKEIKWQKPAELDEVFFGKFGVENTDQIKEKLRENLQNRLEQQVRTQMAEQIYKYLLDKTEFELPVDVIAQQSSSILQRQYSNLMMQGLSKEQLEKQMKQLQAGSEEQAREQLRIFFVMDKVANQLKVEVTEEQINGHIAQSALQRGQRPEKMREQMLRDGALAQFRLQVRENLCIEKLLESAKIKEVEPKKAKIAKKAVKKTTKKVAKKTKPAEKKIAKKTTKKVAQKTESAEKKPLKKRKPNNKNIR